MACERGGAITVVVAHRPSAIAGVDYILVMAKGRQQGIALVEQELQGVRDLWQKNLVQLSRLTSLQREGARLQGERGQLVAQVAEAKGKIAEI